MAKSDLSVAIIGAGQIAGGYDEIRLPGETAVFSHAGAYAANGGFSLDLICDTDLARAEEFRRSWKAAEATDDLGQVTQGEFDIVSVCTPDASHYEIIRALIESACCRVIFAEKPLAGRCGEIEALIALAGKNKISIVVNFQRRFDPIYDELARTVSAPGRVVTANVYYVKGLVHIGVTVLDTLDALFGPPSGVLTYSRVWNADIGEASYEFVLYYDGFNITVKTADSEDLGYSYHLFEIDILFDGGRVILNDNSRQLERRMITDFAYGGVRVLDDKNPQRTKTGFADSMTAAVAYLADIAGGKAHTVNRPEDSLRYCKILNGVRDSFDQGRRIALKETP